MRSALIATVSAVVLISLGLSAPASAATSPPTIVSPANGVTVGYASTGPLVIDFPAADTPRIDVSCASGDYSWTALPKVDAGRLTLAMDPLEGSSSDISGSTCTITILGYVSSSRVVSTFKVGAAEPLNLATTTVSKKKFYPLVKDGYFDDTTFYNSVNRGHEESVAITDAKGHVVYQEDYGWLRFAGRYEATWDGKTTSGKPVLPGKYRIAVTAIAGGVTQTQSATVRVATRMATRRLTIAKKGSQSGRSTAGNCSYRRGPSDEALLDCRGGKYAAATFSYKIPDNARSIRWKATTSDTEDDFAGRGSITKVGQRVGRTTYQVRVQVTGYRATVVDSVRLTYTARVRI